MVSSSWLPVALSSSGMSAIGTKQTWASALHMSAFGGKADIEIASDNRVYWMVRFTNPLNGRRNHPVQSMH